MDIKKEALKLEIEENEYKEILQLFVEVSGNDLAGLKTAIETRDSRRVFEISHSIKGAAETLGFQDISETARKVELNARREILEGSREGYQIIKEKIGLLAKFI